MSLWPSCKASRVLEALRKIGWTVARQKGSHITLRKEEWPDYTFAFHEKEEIGPRMMSRIGKQTDLHPDDL